MAASSELAEAPLELILRPIATSSQSSKEDDHGGTPAPQNDAGDQECRTPRSKESKLPSTPKNCPPAPRKPRRVVMCKRRLMRDFEFIVVGVEELDNLFQRRDQQGNAKKRKLHG